MKDIEFKKSLRYLACLTLAFCYSAWAQDDVIEIGQEDAEHPGIEEQGIDDNELITVTLNEVPVSDAIRMFARLADANVIMGKEYEETISVSLVDVPWEPALREILTSVGLMLVERTPGIFTVTSFREVNAEPLTVDSVFLKFNTVENVLPVVQSMLVSSNASASAFPDANAIIVKESPTRVRDIKAFVERIDLPRPQVFIETKFVELNDQAIKDLGINWQVLQNYTVTATDLSRTYREVNNRFEHNTVINTSGDSFSQGSDSGSTSLTGRSEVEDSLLGDSSSSTSSSGTTGSSTRSNTRGTQNVVARGKNFESFEDGEVGLPSGDDVPFRRQEVLTSVLNADDFALTLSALKKNNGIEVVSNPKVVVASGQEASIHVGVNEPNVIAVPVGDNGDRFFFQLDGDQPFIEIGVKLKVTPTVNTESNITVQIVPELSRKLTDRVFGEGSTQVSFPVTQIRKITTEFNIESGKTVAIGGLTTTDDVEQITKVPLLGDIPIIGKYLFTHTHTEEMQDEIIVFVTVSMAQPEKVDKTMGIPQRSSLIHRQMMQETLEYQEFNKKLDKEREAFEAKLESAEVLEELEQADATKVEKIQPDFLINQPPVIELPDPVSGVSNESPVEEAAPEDEAQQVDGEGELVEDAEVETVEIIDDEIDYNSPVIP